MDNQPRQHNMSLIWYRVRRIDRRLFMVCSALPKSFDVLVLYKFDYYYYYYSTACIGYTL